MSRYLVAERLSKTGPTVSHGPYRTAKKTLKVIKSLGASHSLTSVRDQELKEWLTVGDIKAQVAVEKALKNHRN